MKKLITHIALQLLVIAANAGTPTLLRLTATGNGMQNETVIYFNANGSLTYNPANDAPSLGVDSGHLNIVTQFNSIDYQIKCLPLLTQNISIPVKIITGLTGTYQVFGNNIENLPAGACLMLHDNLTNTDQDLRTGAYTCTIADTENTTRFVLNINISVTQVTSTAINPTCGTSANGMLIASGQPGTAPWNYYWKDSSNNIIKTSLQKTTADTLAGLNAGPYRIDIASAGCSSGIAEFVLQGAQLPTALFVPSADTSSLVAPVSFTNQSMNSGSYWWDFGDGMGDNTENSSHYYASIGTFTVTLTVTGSSCNDVAVYAKEITITNESTAIKTETSEKILISRDQKGYYVKLNDKAPAAVVSVTDLQGRKVITDISISANGNDQSYIDLENSTGMLIISVIASSGEISTKKIIQTK